MVTGSQQLAVKSGYKVTEVGEIPNDWDLIELGEVCKLISDGTHFTPKYVPNGIPFYSVENITNDNFTDVKFISEKEHEILIKRCKPEQNDILLTRIGSVGDTKLIDWKVNASIYVSLALLKIDEKKIIIEYLYSYTKSNLFKNSIKKRSLTNATPQKINMGDIKKIPIPLPKQKNEQIAIATSIFDSIELIQQLDYLITKKKNIKQGTMQELLTGRRRLVGFKEKWTRKRLGKIISCYAGGTPSTSISSYYGGDIPWITSGDLNQKIITNVEGRITKLGFDNSSAQMINENTLLIALYGATAGVVGISLIKSAINQAVLAIIPNDDDMKFIFYKLDYLKKWIIATYTQGGQPNLSKQIIESLELELPSPSEQLAIANILSDMDLEIKELETKRDKYIMIKNGMMQKLLTGEIRLK
jgi:type I restriction enzyme, S subunit